MNQEEVKYDTAKEETYEKPVSVVEEDTKPEMEILSTSMEDGSIKTVVKNNTSYVVRYVRVDVFFYDNDSVNVGSDWTNTSNRIKISRNTRRNR